MKHNISKTDYKTVVTAESERSTMHKI